MSLPSEPTDWVVTSTSNEPGEGVPSVPTDWVVTSTDADAGTFPSLPTAWVITETTGPALQEWYVVTDGGDLVPAVLYDPDEVNAEPEED